MLPIPRFTDHKKILAYLDKDSWFEIFKPAKVESSSNKRYRKLAQVRIANRDGLYVCLSQIRGWHNKKEHPFRKLFGEVVFHTIHERNMDVPFENEVQLHVSYGTTVVYCRDICSVSVYITGKTKFSKELYQVSHKGICDTLVTPLDIELDVNASDYLYGLQKTNNMMRWDYSNPPLTEG